MIPVLIGTIETRYGTGLVHRTGYQSDPNVPAVFITSKDGSPIATLSVNLDGVELGPDEFLAKTWSENEELAKQALESGMFEDTGRRVPTGFVEAQVWRFKGEVKP